MNKTVAVAGVAATALALGGVAATAVAAPAAPQADAVAIQAVAEGVEAASPFVLCSEVQGEFSASQTVVTSTANIVNMFNKAAAAMCAGMPDYDVTEVQGAIAVSGDVDAPYEATISQMAEDQGSEVYLLKCACASNLPGGGAIANAKVQGVPLLSIALAAQAR